MNINLLSNRFRRTKKILILSPNKEVSDNLSAPILEACKTMDITIDIEHDCDKIIRRINSEKYDLQIISPDSRGGDNCTPRQIYNLVKKGKNRNNMIIILEDAFPINASPEKHLLLEGNMVSMRKADFNNINFLENTTRTLIQIPPVYISYGNDDDNGAEIAKKITTEFKKIFPYLAIKYDRATLKYKSDINNYISGLTRGKNIILIINEKYFKSIYCMQELIGIFDTSASTTEFSDRIHPIILDSANFIYNPTQLITIISYWKKKRIETLRALESESFPALEEQLKIIDRIIFFAPKTPDLLKNFYNISLEEHLSNNFIDLLWSINFRLKKDGYHSFYENINEIQEKLTDNSN